MGRLVVIVIFLFSTSCLLAQNFEVTGIQESYKGYIGEEIKAGFSIRNTSQKSITLILKKADGQLGSSQRSLLCNGNDCDSEVDDLTIKLGSGETITRYGIMLEAGLSPGMSSTRYLLINKANPGEQIELDFTFLIEEKPSRSNIYQSRFITLQDVYPNPVSDAAFIEYRLHNDGIQAKIIFHNILGNPVQEYLLTPSESKIRVKAEDLGSGIYFYTLYIDNEGVMTRKLMVKK